MTSSSFTTTGRFSTAPTHEDGHLRLVDDRQAELRAELSGVGDGERAGVHFLGLQLLGARALGEIRDRLAEIDRRQRVGLLHHRHDQPAVERHRDAQVDVLLVDDRVAVERGVQHRVGAQRLAARPSDERHVGEPRAGALVLGFLLRGRMPSTVVKSTWKTVCTCADVRRLSTMCSAILRRITESGFTSMCSPG